MYLVVNKSDRPFFNLALEEYALTRLGLDVIILWRNARAVIIGCNQNAVEEVDAEFTRANGIPIVRRQSGGGAVFHDLGNVNFTVIHEMRGDDFNNYAKFTSPIIDYLATLGVRAELQGRNDLLIDGMKFCGNAQAVKKGRIMHHGCILYSADFTDLARALKPRSIKIESKSVKSVRKRVTNIADHMKNPIPVEDFFAGLALYFMENSEDITPYELTDFDIAETERLTEEKYSTWEWNFGKSPDYNVSNVRRYGYGIVETRLMVEEGMIKDAGIYGDFFGMTDKSELERRLLGLRHEREAITASLEGFDVGACISGMTTEELLDLLC
ncbi:MAG: lipoate--protein ligase [Synergistaceae bacterium]|jgi:lipoate-protein ligase A|nr:lipoate--protein ligase [Synergistaceae bacterium]